MLMKSIKLFLLLVFVFVLATNAMAVTHDIIVGDDAEPSDVLMASVLSSYMVQEGQTAKTHLRSEISEINTDRITISIDNGEAKISYPITYAPLAKRTAAHIEETYGTEPELIDLSKRAQIEEEQGKNLEDIMVPKRERFYEQLQLRTPVIIRGTGDIASAQTAGKSHEGAKEEADDMVNDTDILGNDIYIIGGPCANSHWGQFSERSCGNWDLTEGQGVIKVLNNGARRVILIAGTTAADTEKLTDLFFAGELDDLLGEDKEVIVNLNDY